MIGFEPAEEPEDDPEEEGQTRAIDRQLRTILEWVAVAVGALAVALLIKTFLLQAFYIPSGSMASMDANSLSTQTGWLMGRTPGGLWSDTHLPSSQRNIEYRMSGMEY